MQFVYFVFCVLSKNFCLKLTYDLRNLPGKLFEIFGYIAFKKKLFHPPKFIFAKQNTDLSSYLIRCQQEPSFKVIF